MLQKGNGVQIWVQPDTRDAFKQIMQTTGESQVEMTARLAKEELKRQVRRAQKGGQQI